MKRAVIDLKLMLTLFFCIPLFAYAEEVKKEFTLHYELDEFKMMREGNLISILPRNYVNPLPYFINGGPDIPCLTYKVVLPGNAQVTGIRCDSPAKVLVAQGVAPRMIMAWSPSMGVPPSTEIEWIGEEDYFPSLMEKVANGGVFTYGNIRSLRLEIYPFEYDAVTKSIYFTPDISFEVVYTVPSAQEPSNSTPQQRGTLKYHIDENVLNPEDVPSLKSNIQPLGLTDDYEFTGSSSASDIDYLIITQDSLKNSFDKLINWKFTKGLKCKSVSVQDIYRNRPLGKSNSFVIKAYIDSLVRNHNLSYVLLGGDGLHVPPGSVYCRVNNPNSSTALPLAIDATLPTDLYYACLGDTLDWDRNNNKFAGEITDSISLKPDVIVTRLPVGQKKDVEAVVAKIIDYERYGKYNHSMLIGGVELVTSLPSGESDAQVIAEELYQCYIAGYWDGKVTRRFDTYQDNDWQGVMDDACLTEELKKGYGFVDLQTHGTTTSFLLQNDSQFTKENNAQIENPNSTILLSSACYFNGFDRGSTSTGNPCLSQSLICAPDNGIIAVLGSSRQGWGDGKASMGYSQLYNGMFYKTLFDYPDEQKNFGRIVASVKSMFSETASRQYTPYRWLQFSINPIGDPEMPIFTKRPSTFKNVRVTTSNGMVIVDTGVDDCVISISRSGTLSNYQHVARGVRRAQFFQVPNVATLCVTKQNYLPYVIPIRVVSTNQLQEAEDGEESDVSIEFVGQINAGDLLIKLRNTVENSHKSKIMLTDPMGNLKLISLVESETCNIDIAGLSRGIYIVTLLIDDIPIDNARVILK